MENLLKVAKVAKENPQERRSGNNPNSGGDYLCKRIFINDNQNGSNLYFDDTTPTPAQVVGQLQEAGNEVLLMQPQDMIGRL